MLSLFSQAGGIWQCFLRFLFCTLGIFVSLRSDEPEPQRRKYDIAQWFAKSGPRTGSISVTWEIVRKAHSLAYTAAPLVQKFWGGAAISVLTNLPGESDP